MFSKCSNLRALVNILQANSESQVLLLFINRCGEIKSWHLPRQSPRGEETHWQRKIFPLPLFILSFYRYILSKSEFLHIYTYVYTYNSWHVFLRSKVCIALLNLQILFYRKFKKKKKLYLLSSEYYLNLTAF